MAESIIVSGKTKQEKYESLLRQIRALVEGENDFIANVSNIIAALKYGMNFFWVGIYFVASPLNPLSLRIGKKKQKVVWDEAELVLGPFQGPVACTRIGYGKGVCGTAWKEKRTIIVEDVNKFSGHIACNPASKSEIVIPIFKNGNVIAVLDIDSDKINNFDKTDKKYLEKVAKVIEKIL
jgi:GAF domain-containing protein